MGTSTTTKDNSEFAWKRISVPETSVEAQCFDDCECDQLSKDKAELEARNRKLEEFVEQAKNQTSNMILRRKAAQLQSDTHKGECEWKDWWGPRWKIGDIVFCKYKKGLVKARIQSKHDEHDFRGWWYIDLLQENGFYSGTLIRKGSELANNNA